ncbi:unnamed protein product [Cyclocybe aegerita]|uniref:Uncharacterized protein n=1 Tax=Cyclocybe aegerita TaxID=1973307 RepID=A0A8S0W4I4_CYCAE|nr:unnamed protein product [Cyclocybe aegerita]
MMDPAAAEVVATQPEPMPKPTASADGLPLPITTKEGKQRSQSSSPEPAKPRRPSRVRPFLRAFFGIIFAILRIAFIYLIPGTIFVALAAVLFFGLPFAIASAQGALVMFVGNAILRAAHLEHYTRAALAAAVGATGAPIAVIIIGIVLQCLPRQLTESSQPPRQHIYDEYAGQNEQAQLPWYTTFCTTIVANTLSGTIGSAILLHNHVDLEGMDVLHATRAGATGGAVMAAAMIFVGPVITVVLGILLSPLWIAMLMGLKWVYVRSNETWTDQSYSYSACQCYGTCGGDSEVDYEIQTLQQNRRRW